MAIAVQFAGSSAQAFSLDTYTANSVLSQGRWVKISVGESGIYASLPCVVGKGGVEKVFVPDMPEAEVERWHATCAHIRENISKLDWLTALL